MSSLSLTTPTPEPWRAAAADQNFDSIKQCAVCCCWNGINMSVIEEDQAQYIPSVRLQLEKVAQLCSNSTA
jgi:hypothetical protein